MFEKNYPTDLCFRKKGAKLLSRKCSKKTNFCDMQDFVTISQKKENKYLQK